jgi:hypothetical protein
MPTAENLACARLLWDYLQLGAPVRPAACLLVFGGHDIGVARRAAELYADYAERRIIATARRRWPDKQVAVTSEQIQFDDYLTGDIPADRVLSMLAGEALRLEAYAATGLIDSAEPVPGHILDAAHVLQAAGFSSRAVN